MKSSLLVKPILLLQAPKENQTVLQKVSLLTQIILNLDAQHLISVYRLADIPIFFSLSTGIRLGKLLVGEAAGFQDKLFGFGIRFALISGILAATSFIEIKNYDDLWKPEFMRLMKVSRANRFIFANFSISRQLCCQVLGKSKDPRRTLRTLYSWQRI